jgi:hypothetical protein
VIFKPKAYCPKCKKNRSIHHARSQVVQMTSGTTRNAVRGVCGICSANVFQFVKSGNILSRSRTWISAIVGKRETKSPPH